MEKIMSLRLKERELEFINNLSKTQHTDNSTAVRELINYGWKYFILKEYKEGKISMGNATKYLKLSMGEFIDLLAELGIESPITYEDYLEGLNNLKKLLVKKSN